MVVATTVVAERPNVLFIAIDDYRDYMAAMGSPSQIKTPNMDRLATQGTLFENAYCQAPICGPSRASLLHGMRPSTTGHYGFQQRRLVEAFKGTDTIPGHFKKNGYYVMGGGKIHHGSAPEHGPSADDWHTYFPSITTPSAARAGSVAKDELYKGRELVFGPTDDPVESLQDAQHAAWAVERLQESYDQPFFLAVGFKRPHLPFIAPRKYFEQYPLDAITYPEVLENDLDDVPEAGRMHVKYAIDVALKEAGKTREAVQAYMACVTYIDDLIGTILQTLGGSPYADNTIIVLWSDHGWHLGEKEQWGKVTLWEDACKNPMIITAPGFTRNNRCPFPVELLDIYPTLVELCGLPQPPQQLEGLSLVPQLNEGSAARKQPAITTHGRNSHSIRNDRWRYIRYFDGSEELYDHQNDPKEWTNLAAQPELVEVKKQMAEWIPSVNLPNQPGCTNPRYWMQDYPDLKKEQKKREQLLSRRETSTKAVPQQAVPVQIKMPHGFNPAGSWAVGNKSSSRVFVLQPDGKAVSAAGKAASWEVIDDGLYFVWQKSEKVPLTVTGPDSMEMPQKDYILKLIRK